MADNSNTANSGLDDETSSSISESDLLGKIEKLIKSSVNETVHAAMTQRFAAEEKKRQKVQAEPEAISEEAVSVKGKKSDPRLEEALRQIETLQKERDTEKAQKRDMTLRGALADLLEQNNVLPGSKRALMSLLLHEDKLVGYSEDKENPDEMVFKTKLGEIALDRGIKDYLASKEGKHFVAPKEVKGSGEKDLSKKTVVAEPSEKDQMDAGLRRLLEAGRKTF